MRMMLAVLAVFGTAAPVSAAPAPSSAAVAATTTPDNRQPRACITNRDIRAKRLSAEAGYYVQTRQGWWRNAAGACAALRPDAAVITASNSDRQCSGDVVQLVNPFSRIGYGGCPLRAWEPVAGPPEGVPGR